MFIQIFMARSSRSDEVRAAIDRWQRELGPSAPGWLGSTHGFTDDGVFVAVVRFASRAEADENADRPEQGAWWAETEQLFDGPVEFHDSEDVTLLLEGGSDRAGFVQVVSGTVADVDTLRTLMSDTHDLHERRPEILGATLAIAGDGTFTETVAFTDESAARAAEAGVEMPEEARRAWESAVRDVRFLDLRRPWFASAG